MNNQISKERLKEVKRMRIEHWCRQYGIEEVPESWVRNYDKKKFLLYKTKKTKEEYKKYVATLWDTYFKDLMKHNVKVGYLPFKVLIPDLDPIL
jgi:hypothetical protein